MFSMVTTTFKFVISDPKTGRTFQKDVEKKKVPALLGLKVGDEFDAGIIGLPGYHLKITGGSDESGFPIRKGVIGSGRKRLLLAEPPGYKPERKGIRKRKTVRGATLSEDLVQINTKVVKYGKQSLEEFFGVKVEEPKAEKEEKKAEPVRKEELDGHVIEGEEDRVIKPPV